MSCFFELIIFTAASKEYADKIVEFIDKDWLIQHTLSQEHLLIQNKTTIKDLSWINRDLKTTIIIDDIPSNFSL